MKSYKKAMALLMGTALLTGTLSGCGNTATEQAASKDTNEYFMCTEETAPCAGAEVPYDSNAKYIVMPQDTDFNTESYEKPEEFINYFKYDLNSPKDGEKFGITTEVSTCPWNEDHQLMFVGMKTEDIDLDEAPVNNLVFLIDVSGSMFDENKLPLLQKSFKELVYNLPDEGCVSIVTYASGEKVVLSGESLANKQVIADAIDSLSAGGSTNGEAGIQKAYEIAANNYIDSFFEAKKVLVEGHALCRQRYRAVKGRYDRTGA